MTMPKIFGIFVLSFLIGPMHSAWSQLEVRPGGPASAVSKGGVSSSGGGSGTEVRVFEVMEKLRKHFSSAEERAKFPELTTSSVKWNLVEMTAWQAFEEILRDHAIGLSPSPVPLFDRWGHRRTMIYHRDRMVIEVYAADFWELLPGAQILLVFHEILALLGIENETADPNSTYPVSPRLDLNLFRANSEDILSLRSYEDGTFILKFSCERDPNYGSVRTSRTFSGANLYLVLSRLDADSIAVKPEDFKNWQIDSYANYVSTRDLLFRKKLAKHIGIGGQFAFETRAGRVSNAVLPNPGVIIGDENDPTNILMSTTDLRIASVNIPTKTAADGSKKISWVPSLSAEFRLNLQSILESRNSSGRIRGSVMFTDLIPVAPRKFKNTIVMGGFLPGPSEFLPIVCDPEVSEWNFAMAKEMEIAPEKQMRILSESLQLFGKINKERYGNQKPSSSIEYEMGFPEIAPHFAKPVR